MCAGNNESPQKRDWLSADLGVDRLTKAALLFPLNNPLPTQLLAACTHMYVHPHGHSFYGGNRHPLSLPLARSFFFFLPIWQVHKHVCEVLEHKIEIFLLLLQETSQSWLANGAITELNVIFFFFALLID